MKKIVSLVLTIVLMVSVFAMLGTVTASAETYEITNELVNLTFDGDAPYGIVAHRKISDIVYNEAGYVEIHNINGNGAMAFFGKDGTVGAAPVERSETDDISQFTAAQLAAYNNLFMFEAGKNYKITFNYKVLAGTTNPQAYPRLQVYSNPLLKTADPVREITGSSSSVRVLNASINVPRINYTLTDGVLAEDTDWAAVEITFTTKDDETGFCFGLYSGYAAKKDSICAFDNFKVEELIGSYSYDETGVYTMDNNELVDMSATTVTFEDDAEKGKVAKVVGGNGGRAYIPNTPIAKENTKYFITFDAKGIAEGNFINLGFGRVIKPGACRIFVMGYNDTARGARLYINGVETTIKEGFTNVTTEWQSYGIVIDTSNADFIEATNVVGQGVLAEATYVFLGAQESTVYFDNVKIVEVGAVPTVVPEKDESAKYSIRETAAGTTAGLRFRGSVANTVKATADEIGFVVAPVKLVAGDADWYKLDSLNAAAKKAVAFDGTKDVVYSSDAETTSYQLILTKLDNILVQRFAAVMYVKTGDTYDYISLGEISYNQVLAEYAVRGK